MVEERERKPNYNPADYAQLQVEAAIQSKKELEDFYVLTKDKKHIKCGAKFGILLFTLFAIFMIGALGWVLAESFIESDVVSNVKKVSSEICPMLDENYVSDEFIEDSYFETRIICTNSNSNPE